MKKNRFYPHRAARSDSHYRDIGSDPLPRVRKGATHGASHGLP